jgi:hypothetical protein
MLDRTTPRLGCNELHRALVRKDADVPADSRERLLRVVGEFLGAELSFLCGI